ncbi:hypothetical protein K491DRAFT_586977 [Lophiostoma macrostomum CBS 122681]|uniref:Rhodopsin domain-containing protein n=1 Tax=Lophiostoma macrostomum CBS 122681 TaxID=1314788 RepID=A0A6A6TPW5_9PLEO|nr:hypothetical protein K491DRAFT_586977 [Lophiostoma macrostomum CBS 122681]
MVTQYAEVLPDRDRGGQLAATYIAGCVVSLFFVIMRLTARFSIAGVGIDDWCMLITWIVFLPFTIIISILSFEGGTRHMVYLAQDPAHVEYILKLNWIAQPLAIFCLGSAKVAVAFLILRLLNRTSVWRRWSLYIASAWTIINTILMIVFTFVQCEDPAALWNAEARKRTKCWDPSVQSTFSTYGASCHALMDIFLAFLPVTLVWGLQTSLRKRIALCGLLGCGSITGICAAIKATKLSTLNARSDMTWETFSLFLWTGIELILSIICGSIPALKPIYAICMGKRALTLRSSQRRTNATGSSRTPHGRRSYARQHNSDSRDRDRNGEGMMELGSVQSPMTVSARRASDDEIGLAVSGDWEKAGGGIHVTRTFDVE